MGHLQPLSDVLPYLFGLLGIVEGPDPLAQMDPQVKRRRTLDAIKRILLRESLNQPLVVIFEDLHWIDEQTQALLDLLADSSGSERVLLLVNYRPEYRHEWGNKSHYVQLGLNPLDRERAEELLAVLLEDAMELRPLKRLIIERTGGNPFFIEEIVQALFDEGALVRNGAVKVTRSLSQLRLPPTVQGILAARIDRLSGEQKELLQTLAVIGRESPLGLIRQVASTAEARLERVLADLQAVEFIYEQAAGTSSEYVFKHALTQEVAYNSLLIERRKYIHEQAGQALESIFADRLDDHLTQLAHHYSHSDNNTKAIKYLQMAAQQAEFRLAHHDGMRHYLAAVRLLKCLPESVERDRRELELWQGYLQVVVRTREWSTKDAGTGFERAIELCERLGDTSQQFRLLRRLSEFHSGRAEHRVAHDLAVRMLDIAKSSRLQSWLQSAYTQLGTTLYYLGDFRLAHRYLDESLRCTDDSESSTPNLQNALVHCLSVDAEALWMLGYADQAHKRSEESLDLARNCGMPSVLALALTHAHMLSFFSGEYEKAIEFAQKGLKLCAQRKFEFLETALAWSCDNVRIFMGLDNDIEKPRKAFAAYHEIGTKLHLAANCMFLARCCAILGRPDLAAAMIEQSIAATEETEQRTWEAESWRVNGELTIQLALQRKLSGQSQLLYIERLSRTVKQQ